MRAIAKDNSNTWRVEETRNGNFKVINTEYFGKTNKFMVRWPYYGFKTKEKADSFIMRRIKGKTHLYEIDKNW